MFGAPLIPAVLRGTALGGIMVAGGLLRFLAGAAPNAAQRGDRRVRSMITGCMLAGTVLLTAHLLSWLINTSPDHQFDSSWAASALSTSVGQVELWRVGLTLLALWAWWLARRPRLALAFAGAALAGAICLLGVGLGIWNVRRSEARRKAKEQIWLKH